MEKKREVGPQSRVTATREMLRVDRIVPDEKNRDLVEDEDFVSLVDSVRVLGLLQALHVRALGDGTATLIDGERRWRAAKLAGLTEVPCEVWPAEANPRETLVAGIVLNEQRKAHSPVHVAKRLREIKCDFGLTLEQLADRTGMPVDRVKSYLALLSAGDALLRFLEEMDVPVKVALEMVRYEKATSERRAEKLIERYAESPLTRQQIAALRKAVEHGERESPAASRSASSLAARLESALAKDAAATLEIIRMAVGKVGFVVVEREGAQGA
jgi:ParB family chromosome partitioning protein